jgi:hypothetical protein
MNRYTGTAGILAAIMTLGLARDAQSQAPAPSAAAAPSQERAALVGAATCIDAEGKYVITWTLTLVLGEQEGASAESGDALYGIDLIGAPQTDAYPFAGESGNLFAAVTPRLVNGPNVATTSIDTAIYNPETMTAAGSIIVSAGLFNVTATVNRPAACAA